jgi:hypothetical protein
MGIAKDLMFRLMTQYIQSGEPVIISPDPQLGSHLLHLPLLPNRPAPEIELRRSPAAIDELGFVS